MQNSNKSYSDLVLDFNAGFQQKLGNYILGHENGLSIYDLEKLLQDPQTSLLILQRIADLGLQHNLAKQELQKLSSA